MSSAVVSTSAAQGRPFIFDAEPVPQTAFPSSAPAPLEKARPPQRIRIADLNPGFSSTDPRLSGIIPASRLDVRPAPAMVSSGIAALDPLAGGLPRGCLTEICGPASSGRTTLLLAALAATTRRGEFCVVVDASDALDPHSVAAAGVDLDRLLWVRCGENSSQKDRSPQRHPSASLRAGSDTEKEEGKKISQLSENRTGLRNRNQSEHRLEQVLRATDMLLESGGFGLIALDLTDLPPQTARRIPLTTWFRFRRAVEHTPTVLLSLEQHPIAGSCSSLLLKLEGTGAGFPKLMDSVGNVVGDAAEENPQTPAAKRRHSLAPDVRPGYGMEAEASPDRDGTPTTTPFPGPTHAQLLTGLEITVELLRSRLERKPARAASMAFASKTAWAG
jgi:hypothetical protein